jgi:hypothetical protein
MIKIFAAVLALALAFPVFAKGGRHSGSHASRGGHYAGGKGSSHKSGHYKNVRTGDHYQKKNK